jgi:glucuronoarabinoxylan endo-1,4-beta-xylanase
MKSLLRWIMVAGILVGTAMRGWTADVVVDAKKQYQTIDGFGTCLISWEPAMARYYERPDVARIYAQDLRFNILRCNLWGDGTIGPVEDWTKISYKDPAFAAKDTRTPVFLQFARAIKRINPDVKVIGTVWSPPAWMKENGKITDTQSNAALRGDYRTDRGQELRNRVQKKYYPHFVKWLVEMAKYYAAHGVPLYAISPANEPEFTQTFESCVWSSEDLVTIIGMLGEELEQEGLGAIKIFGPESMTGFNWDGGPNARFVRMVQANPAAWKHFGIFATHGYTNGVTGEMGAESSAGFWNLIKATGKPYWVTEGGTGEHSWPAAVGPKGVAAGLHNAFVAGNASAFVPWQFAENASSENNLMRLSGPTKKTQVVRHYSRFIPAGSVRIGADPAYGAVLSSAYAVPGGQGVTIVLTNPGETPQEVTVQLKGLARVKQLTVVRTSATEDSKTLDPVMVEEGKVRVSLPKQSIVTLTTVK